MKKIFVFIWEVIKIVFVALLIVIPIRYFIFQPFFVKGQSMEPNFENGDYLIVDEISYYFRAPERGEVIVFRYPNDPTQRYIKRIIGLPGETVEIKDGKITAFDQGGAKVLEETSYLPPSDFTPGDLETTLNQNQYFVMGDNRIASSDSRRWGPLDKNYIIGRVIIRAWPFVSAAEIKTPSY
jgi:signal peptidase I